MASQLDICRVALGHIGDVGTITSIDPPEKTVQAAACARLYPIALDELLGTSKVNWNFALRRVALAQVTNPSSTWAYAYARPDACIRVVAILDPAAPDENNAVASTLIRDYYDHTVPVGIPFAKAQQPYLEEGSGADGQIILTNQATAVCRYTFRVINPAVYSSLFTNALGLLLGSYLAGPIVRGKSGIELANALRGRAMALLMEAAVENANNRKSNVQHNASWIESRA